MHSHRVTALFALASLTGCGGTSDPRELVAKANVELNTGEHASALAKFERAQQALADRPDDPLYHAARLGAIDARVHSDAKAATSEFLAYATQRPSQVRDSDYIYISGKLASANAFAEALDIVQAGATAFVGSERMKAQEKRVVELSRERANRGDDELLRKLASMQYLGGK